MQNTYVVKPFTTDTIKEKLEQMFDKYSISGILQLFDIAALYWLGCNPKIGIME